ncbi:MAG: hypothetical protein H0V89_02995 [Deltaproteobacteria bacterium]|nr:hypothetical protein [Deltaproteobacteria bacterium]
MTWYRLRHGSVWYGPGSDEGGDVALDRPATFTWGDGEPYENPELGREVQRGNPVAREYVARIASMARPTPQAAQPCPSRVGTPEWYDFRVADHERRGGSPDDLTTAYYLSYGKKYGHRFSEERYPHFTPAGKHWCEAVRVYLHLALEMELLKSPEEYARLELENRGLGLRTLAFDTHSDAYVAAGVSSLPAADLAIIFSTPDLQDLVSPTGIWQALETAPSVVKEEVKKLFGSRLDQAAIHAQDKIERRGTK